MEMENIKKFCRDWLPAWTGNNPEKLITFYSENAYYQDPANPKGLKGHKEILPYFKKLLVANPNWKWEALEIFSTKKGFTIKWKASIPVGTEGITENGMDIVEIEKGKITRNEVYFDRSRLLSLLEQYKKKEISTDLGQSSNEKIDTKHCPSCGKEFDILEPVVHMDADGPSYSYCACSQCKRAWEIGPFERGTNKLKRKEVKYIVP